MKKSLCFLFTVFVSLSLSACGRGEGKPFEASVFSFDQSAALLFAIEDKTVLLNTGGPDDAKKILRYCHEKGISRIDVLIIASFTSDCMGGAEKIIKNMEIGRVYEPAYSMGNEYVKEYYFALSTKDIIPIVVTDDLALPMGQGSLDLFVSGQKIDRETDNQTIAVKANFSGQKLLYWPPMGQTTSLTDGHCDLSCDFVFVPDCDDLRIFEELLLIAKPHTALIETMHTEQQYSEAEQVGQKHDCKVYFNKQEILSIQYKNGQTEIEP